MRSYNPVCSFLFLGSSLGRSIALSCGFLLMAVVVINVWSFRESWDMTVKTAQISAVNFALSQARQAEDTFLQTEILLREIQRNIQRKTPVGVDGVELALLMREQRSRLPLLEGLFYYDGSGHGVAWSTVREPAVTSHPVREYFDYHRLNGHNNIHIGPVIYSQSTGERVIPVSLRLNDSYGGFAGVLVATVRVSYFKQFYGYYELGDKDVLVLMRDDGTVLYARPMPEDYVGKNLSSSPLFREMLVKSNQGSGEWDSELDGLRRIFGFVRSERYPLVVAAGYDIKNLSEAWSKNQQKYVGLNAALIIIILVGGFYVLREAKKNVSYQREMKHLHEEMKSYNQTLQAMAMIDSLTGLPNRRHFDIFLSDSLQRSHRSGNPVSLVMLDIDFFKQYNDAYGHVAGDQCLESISDALREMPLRGTDLTARYGGEEFVIVLPDASPEEALKIASRAVHAIRQRQLSHCASEIPERIVTLSAGCCSVIASGKETDAQMIKECADIALYQAKAMGRNQAVLCTQI